MPLSAHVAMLSSLLIVTVADRVPEFDAGPSCQDSTVPDCQTMEKIARDRLVKDWSTFTTHDKAMCVMEEKMSGPRSYVGWLTCLEINANARSPEARSGDSGAPAAATGDEVKPERHGRVCRKQ
jgi:hypothetical protein